MYFFNFIVVKTFNMRSILLRNFKCDCDYVDYDQMSKFVGLVFMR